MQIINLILIFCLTLVNSIDHKDCKKCKLWEPPAMEDFVGEGMPGSEEVSTLEQ